MSKDPKQDFFTIISRDENIFSDYVKKFYLYDKKWNYLPTARYIYDKEECYPLGTLSCWIKYKGSPTPEQYHVLNTIRTRINDHQYGCGLIIMWTGKGKGHVAMQITTMLHSKTLILTHNIKTLEEMVVKFKEFTTVTPWVYYGKKKKMKEVTITTHSSFAKNPEVFTEFDVIIYDECDHSLNNNMFQALIKSWAHYLYGMTGTPYKKELYTEDIEKIFGKRITYTKEEKYNIVPSQIDIYRYRASYMYEYQNWAEQRAAMYQNQERIEYQAQIIKRHSKLRNGCLVLSDRIEEVILLAEACDNLWIATAIITGETKTKADDVIIQELNKGSVQVIFATTGKMARGVDIPIIDTVFMFATLRFEWTVVQAVWRALRLHPKKKDVHVIDFSDDECKNQRYQRVGAYKKEYGIPPEKILLHKQIFNDTKLRLL